MISTNSVYTRKDIYKEGYGVNVINVNDWNKSWYNSFWDEILYCLSSYINLFQKKSRI